MPTNDKLERVNRMSQALINEDPSLLEGLKPITAEEAYAAIKMQHEHYELPDSPERRAQAAERIRNDAEDPGGRGFGQAFQTMTWAVTDPLEKKLLIDMLREDLERDQRDFDSDEGGDGH